MSDEFTGGCVEVPRWYAVAVKPQHEFQVLRGLNVLEQMEAFLPTYKEKRFWTDRAKVIEVPLFNGYVFARFDFKAWQIPVLRLAGVRSIVGFAGEPMPIPDQEIFNIRQLVAAKLPLQPWLFVKSGDRVRIEHRPLRGVEGTILRQKDRWCMVVNIDLLNRSVSVTLDRSVLKRIGPVVTRRIGPTAA
jgi:transcription antitermination factor NusG